MMSFNKCFWIIIVTLFCVNVSAQDKGDDMGKEMSCVGNDSLFPKTFLKTKDPYLVNGELMSEIFNKLDTHKEPVRILHLGDSHVRGHVFSVEVKSILEEAWGKDAVEEQNITYKTSAIAKETGKPGIIYHTIGINGAEYRGFDSFEKIVQIAQLKPDLIILSFGTNEAHGRNYSDIMMREELDSLILHIRGRLPNTLFMLTTPPGSYLSKRVSYTRNGKRRYTYRKSLNQNTPKVAECQKEYAREKGLIFFDLYNIVGGEVFALKNWESQGMLGRDGIHYTREGYKLMGKLLAQAILNERCKRKP